jgi:hypothetical protein
VMLFGPQRPAVTVDEAVSAKDAENAALGGLGVLLVRIPKTKELAQSLLVFGGNMNRGQVTTSVETGEIFGIESVGLAAFAGLSGDERWSDDLAVETVSGEHSMKHETGARSLVAGFHGSLVGKAPDEPSDLHEIPGEPHDFRDFRISFENRGRDRIEMHVETDPGILCHGWTPPKNKLSVSITHVALAQVHLLNLS